MCEIVEGNRVFVRSADNRIIARRAVSGVVTGDDFLVVWVCQEDEWIAAGREQRPPNSIP